MPCPAGVDIPGCFRCIMRISLPARRSPKFQYFGAMGTDGGRFICRALPGLRECEKACPSTCRSGTGSGTSPGDGGWYAGRHPGPQRRALVYRPGRESERIFIGEPCLSAGTPDKRDVTENDSFTFSGSGVYGSHVSGAARTESRKTSYPAWPFLSQVLRDLPHRFEQEEPDDPEGNKREQRTGSDPNCREIMMIRGE